MSRPTSIIFFSNGLACVGDEDEQQMGKYQVGKHQDTIQALKEDGYDWTKLDVTGSPMTKEQTDELYSSQKG
jgi:arabinogalactan endo-1,4-beta-galactosidase